MEGCYTWNLSCNRSDSGKMLQTRVPPRAAQGCPLPAKAPAAQLIASNRILEPYFLLINSKGWGLGEGYTDSRGNQHQAGNFQTYSSLRDHSRNSIWVPVHFLAVPLPIQLPALMCKDLEKSSGFWFQTGSALTTAAIWRMNQYMDDPPSNHPSPQCPLSL